MNKRRSIVFSLGLVLALAGMLGSSGCGDRNQELEPGSWQEWSSNKRVIRYMGQVKEITEEIKNSGIPLDLIFRKLSDNDKRSLIVLEELHSTGLKIIQRLIPPKELEGYHQRIVESISYGSKVINSILEADAGSASLYLRKSIKANIESSQEIKNLYIELSAPRELIGLVDKAITYDREALRAITFKKSSDEE